MARPGRNSRAPFRSLSSISMRVSDRSEASDSPKVFEVELQQPLGWWRTMVRQGPEDLAAIAHETRTALFGYGSTVAASCLTSN
jgi:hypothetical protein